VGQALLTYQKKNVAIVIPLKDACALSFFKGALPNDPKHILEKIGERCYTSMGGSTPEDGNSQPR
jgi:uncharacterized protein YdeI (YjbR/CyaY-like superfamily)